MLNVYNYYLASKSLPAPGEKVVQQWVAKRTEEMPGFLKEFWKLQDDYKVDMNHNDKPNGDSWFSAKWGRDEKITFYIPAQSFAAYDVDNIGNIIDIYPDPYYMLDEISDSLSIDGAYGDDDYEDDEYEDDYDNYDD